MIPRLTETNIKTKPGGGKAIILLGARQTGKTTLLNRISENLSEVLWLNANEPNVTALFYAPSSTRFKAWFAGYKTVLLMKPSALRTSG